MKPPRLAWAGCKWLLGALASFALWTGWLALTLLLAAQVYIATHNEIEAPAFVRRALQERLAASGVAATFGRTLFDPSGRVLIEDVAVRLPGFDEPVVTARALYVRLDFWGLATGRFEPLELWVTDAALRVPAPLSPSGKSDAVVNGLDGSFRPRGSELAIDRLAFFLGSVRVTARGAVDLVQPPGRHKRALPLADFLARNYAVISRQLADAEETFGAAEHPEVHAELRPTGAQGAIADVTLLADGVRMEAPIALQARGIRIAGSLPIPLPDNEPVTVVLGFFADTVDLPGQAGARGVRGAVHALLEPGRLRFTPQAFRSAEIAAADASTPDGVLQFPVIRLDAGPLPALGAALEAVVFGQPVAVAAAVDLKERTADLSFEGGFAPDLLDVAGKHAGRDLRRFVDLAEPVEAQGRARLGPQWKFQGAEGRVAARNVTVMAVKVDEVKGVLSYRDGRLAASEADIRIGDSRARGTYEEEMATRNYRMVLAGKLRPLDISGWFPRQEWWKAFFGNFDFPSALPTADADVRGCWSNGRKAVVFVAAECASPVVRGVAFDLIRTRVFVRPNFDDGLEFLATEGTTAARGTFARRYNMDAATLQSLEFDGTSTLDPSVPARIYGPKAEAAAAAFSYDRPPEVKVSGRIEGPAGGHYDIAIEGKSDGRLGWRGIYLDRAAFAARVRDGDISISHLDGAVAGGTVTAAVTVSGSAPHRRVSFSGALDGANLGQVIGVAQAAIGHFGEKKSSATLTSLIKDKANLRIDLSASAEGPVGDFAAFAGKGSVKIEGTELGKVRMLGLLSQLLPFTSLRFNTAKADFRIEGPRVQFPLVLVSGANSEIQAHGSMTIADRGLDFRAKVFPFERSKSLPQKFADVVLAPLSNAFQVKLGGTIEKPHWILANDPLNLLKDLGSGNGGPAKPAPKGPVAGP